MKFFHFPIDRCIYLFKINKLIMILMMTTIYYDVYIDNIDDYDDDKDEDMDTDDIDDVEKKCKYGWK